MSKLDDILSNGTQLYEAGKNKIVWSPDPVKQQIKDLMLELVDDTVMGLGGDVPYGELTKKIKAL